MYHKTLAAFTVATQLLARALAQDWDSAYSQAQSALSGLSLSDKVGIVTGVGWNPGGACVGNTSPVSSIGYPSLCLQDGPLGVRYASSITAFTPGVQAASTWDLDLIRQRGQYIGEEFRGTGSHVMLGPVAGGLGKIAEGGRNWEGFSPDPYLTGIMVAETIDAVQGVGVQTAVKHYILNEQELNRETMSSNPDDRTTHELYLWPYVDAIHAESSAVMCSYNKIHGVWACESEFAMNTMLKERLGFKGYVVTDWAAQHSTAASANAGLDMTMPGSNWDGGDVYWGPQLESAVRNGQVSQSRVDDMATRILAAWYRLGQNSGYPNVNFDVNVAGNHKENVRACARDGTVLLRNENNILPLTNPSTIAVIGSSAVIGAHARNECQDGGCNSGALGMGWGSGAVDYPYFVAPYDAINERASSEGARVVLSNSDNTGSGASAAQGADVAIVFITADSGEGYIEVEGNRGDRNNLDPWHNGNALVEAVANANENVIVVVHSTGPIILESILSHASVKGIVWAGLPSQESGNALVDVLWGDTNPSGKLVYTIAKQRGDYGTEVVNGNDDYDEGLYIDYRHFDNAGIEPRYEFGFGLSTFEYGDISIDAGSIASGSATGSVISGGPSGLFEDVATITVSITNTGSVDGAEVAQLYLSYPSSTPDTPPLQLRGFDKLSLGAGESGTATFNLRWRDLSYWDVGTNTWVVPAGEFGVSVGASSRDIRQEGSLVV
uniref:beta-glucosidase n=1 Tax=fungal sp. TaxID=1709941 RepID=A0A6G7SK71_9FUNG|nr:glycoside hydrolase family 3 [fungal sp.]